MEMDVPAANPPPQNVTDPPEVTVALLTVPVLVVVVYAFAAPAETKSAAAASAMSAAIRRTIRISPRP
jgi:hypothetical protein